jgi:FkbM family methyltransferase
MRIPTGPTGLELADGCRVCAHVAESGSFEPETLDLWVRHCRTLGPGVALDVGSYSGVYAIAACLASRMLEVVAFEPLPWLADRVASNARLNGDMPVRSLRVVRAAASSYDGQAVMGYNASVRLTSAARIGREKGRQITVRTVRVDTAVGVAVGPVLAVKIDAEGHELEVLRGARATLAYHRPALLVVETLGDEAEQTVLDQLGGLYVKRGMLDGRNLVLRPR